MSLEQIALGLVRDYQEIKYSSYVTLHGYAMYWDEAKKTLSPDPRSFPRNAYYLSWKTFIEELKASKDWAKPLYKMPDTPIFEKQNILAQVLANKKLVREQFLKRVSEELQPVLANIVYERELIRESANMFIDTFNAERVQREPEKNHFEHFLEHYDLEKKTHKQKPNISYQHLLLRLKAEDDWERLYMQNLEEKDSITAKRLQGIFECIETNNFEEKERMEMLESLTEKGCVGLVEAMGQDAYDLLVALYGEEQFPEEKRHYLSSGKAIRPHLGKCRRIKINPEMNIWEKDLLKALKEKGFKSQIYDKSTTIQRILQNNFITPYLKRWEKGENITSELDLKQKEEEDLVTKRLLRYTSEHFAMMTRVEKYPQISHILTQVKIR
ncbi:MAG TPA: hypothetical protein HA294_00280 [Nanoarchaeota archaeon]|nr:hypothetical protein [Candidatus Woesearchaeota archaeon]HIH58424.1 hypothetical protein [Nanoarchaeota archaeon]HIJ04484.1 hypothetical protein [Nanoarchaeota archaeon]